MLQRQPIPIRPRIDPPWGQRALRSGRIGRADDAKASGAGRRLTGFGAWRLLLGALGTAGALAAVLSMTVGIPPSSPTATPTVLLLAEPEWPLTAAFCVVLLAAGALAGFLSGLLGIGGALIIIPTLHLVLPFWTVAPDRLAQTAIATSLAVMVPTALSTAASHWRRGTIETGWLRRLAPGMLVGGLLGAALSVQLRGPVLCALFAAQSIYYGVRMLLPTPAGRPAGTPSLAPRRAWHRLPSWLAASGIGGFCACVGMGGGSMSVPYLNGQRVTLVRATATSGCLNLFIAIGGATTFVAAALSGTASLFCGPAALLLIAGSLTTTGLGTLCAGRVPDRAFGKLIGVVNVAGALVLLRPFLLA